MRIARERALIWVLLIGGLPASVAAQTLPAEGEEVAPAAAAPVEAVAAEDDIAVESAERSDEAPPSGDAEVVPVDAVAEVAPVQMAPADEPDSTATVDDEPQPATDEAATEAEDVDDFRDAWVSVGLRAGVYIPTIVNEMTPHADLSLEVGVQLPFLERRLAVIADASYAPPGRAQTLDDPRIGPMGGEWTYSMVTHHVRAGLGVLFRFLPPGSFLNGYISALGRVVFLETRVDGSGNGSDFGEHVEQSSQGGVSFALGGELRLGPGVLLAEVGFGYTDLPHLITGATSTGALGVQLGYRIFF